MSTISASTTTTTAFKVTSDTTGTLVLQTGSTPTTAVTIDTSGNFGLGVTPSAWGTSGTVLKTLQLGSGYSFIGGGNGFADAFLGANAYYNGTNWIYSSTNGASYYNPGAGYHKWYTAPSGTAGNTITFTQAMTLDNSGNLGIGTSSPRAKLDVSGSVLVGTYQSSTNYAPLSVKTASSITTPSTFTNAINIWNSTTIGEYSNITFGYNTLGLTNAAAYIGYISTSSTTFGKGDLVFGTRDVGTDTAATERMRIDSSGNLGIGTSSPTYKLQVQKSADGGLAYFRNTSGSNQPALYIKTNDASNIVGFDTDYALSTSPAITFSTGGTERMRLNSSGNLGIGTTSPTYRVDIDSTNAGGNILSGTRGTSQLVAYQGASSTGYFGMQSNNNLIFITNGTNQATLDTSGNLGIGTTPSAASSAYRTFQLYDTTSMGLFGSGYGSNLTANAYINSSTWTRGGNSYAPAKYAQFNGVHTWSTAAAAGTTITWTDAMTLDASGSLLVGTTNSSPSSGAGFKVNTPVAGHWDPSVVTTANSASYSCWDIYSTATSSYRFWVTTTGVVNAVSTTITAISDQRLKENIRDLDDGLATVMALKPRKFDWKEGKGADTKNARGFIAQEFEQVFPDLIDEWKDPAPEGEEPYKAVRADLIPTLVKAIQELKAEFDAYKASHP